MNFIKKCLIFGIMGLSSLPISSIRAEYNALVAIELIGTGSVSVLGALASYRLLSGGTTYVDKMLTEDKAIELEQDPIAKIERRERAQLFSNLATVNYTVGTLTTGVVLAAAYRFYQVVQKSLERVIVE
jgi:hypothetical protein